MFHKAFKKKQYDATIEFCSVHKFSEKSIFYPNKQLKFTKMFRNFKNGILSINYTKALQVGSVESF